MMPSPAVGNIQRAASKVVAPPQAAASRRARAATRPRIFWVSGPVRPGDIAMIIGSGLAGCTTIRVHAPADKSGISEKPIRDSDTCVMFRVPRRLPAGEFRIALYTPAQIVHTVLNRPKIWWVQGNLGRTASPGGWVRAFGRNLSGSATLDAKPLTVRFPSPFEARFRVPETLAPGTHVLRIGDGMAATVRILNPVADTTARATTSISAAGADDRAAIQGALDALGKAGGGTLLLPSRRYRISAMLTIPEFVTLRGAGMRRTVLTWANSATPPAALIRGASHFCIEHLTIHCKNCHNGIESNHDPAWASTVVANTGHVTLRRVRLRMNPFMGELKSKQLAARELQQPPNTRTNVALYLGGPDVRVLHCRVRAASSAFRLVHCRGLIVRDNTIVVGYSGWNNLEGCDGVFFSHNTITGGSQNAADGTSISCYTHSYSENIYYANNRIRHIYGWDREGITTDAGGGEFTGHVAADDKTSVTLAGKLKVPNNVGPVLGSGCALFVVAGRGMGEYARVATIAGKNIALTRSFPVPLDKTSIVSLTMLQRHYLFVRNKITSAGCGLQYFSTAIDCIAWHNLAKRTTVGFRNIGMPYGGFVEPSWYIQWLGNRTRQSAGVQLGVYGGSWLKNSEPTTLGCIVRGNRIGRHGHIQVGGFYRANVVVNPHYPFTQDVVVDNNRLRRARIGLLVRATAVEVTARKNRYGHCTKDAVPARYDESRP